MLQIWLTGKRQVGSYRAVGEGERLLTSGQAGGGGQGEEREFHGVVVGSQARVTGYWILCALVEKARTGRGFGRERWGVGGGGGGGGVGGDALED